MFCCLLYVSVSLDFQRLLSLTRFTNTSFEFHKPYSFLYQNSPLILSLPNFLVSSLKLKNLNIKYSSSPLLYGGNINLQLISSNFEHFSTNVIVNQFRKKKLEVNDSKIKIENCVFSDITASLPGGAINCFNCTFKITNSTFQSCTSSKSGAIRALYSNFIILNTNFSGNAALNIGAIESSNSVMTIQKCIFAFNWAIESISTIRAIDSSMDIYDCGFIGNRAEKGKSIYAVDSNFKVRNSEFFNNNCDNFKKELGLITVTGKNSLTNVLSCRFFSNRDNNQTIVPAISFNGNLSASVKFCRFDETADKAVRKVTNLQGTPNVIIENCKKNLDIKSKYQNILDEFLPLFETHKLVQSDFESLNFLFLAIFSFIGIIILVMLFFTCICAKLI